MELKIVKPRGSVDLTPQAKMSKSYLSLNSKALELFPSKQMIIAVDPTAEVYVKDGGDDSTNSHAISEKGTISCRVFKELLQYKETYLFEKAEDGYYHVQAMPSDIPVTSVREVMGCGPATHANEAAVEEDAQQEQLPQVDTQQESEDRTDHTTSTDLPF